MVGLLSEFVVELAIVIFSAIIGTVVALKLRQPAVLGFLAVGAVIGPNVLGLVRQSVFLDAFAQVGAILILFFVGLEFSLKKLLGVGFRAAIIATVKISILFLVAFEIGLALGMGQVASAITGMVFSITSTAIAIKILKQKWLMLHEWVPLLVSVLVVEDIIAIFFLTLVSNMAAGATTNIVGFIASTLLGFVGLGVFYLGVSKGLAKISSTAYFVDSSELYVFVALGLVLAFTIAAGALGLSPSIGAFLAGSLVAEQAFAKKIEEAINPFQLSFSAIFFISIGTLIRPDSIAGFGASWTFVAAFLAVCFATVVFLVKLVGSGKYPSAVFGLSMLPLGEFSLIIAREGSGIAGGLDIVTLAASAVFVTGLVASAGLEAKAQVSFILAALVPQRLKAWIGAASEYTAKVFSEFEPNGYFFGTVKREVEEAKENLPFAVAAGLAVLLCYILAQAAAKQGIDGPIALAVQALLYVFGAAFAASLGGIALKLKVIVDALSNIFSVGKSHKLQPGGTIKRVFYNLFLGLALVAFGLALPVFMGLIRAPQAFHILGALFVAWGALLVYKSVRLIGKFTFRENGVQVGGAKPSEIEAMVKNLFPKNGQMGSLGKDRSKGKSKRGS